YARSVVKDWSVRQGMVRIDFKAEFGADVDLLDEQPRTSREMEVKRLGELLNRDYTEERLPRKELARKVNGILTDYIAGITGQRVETSDEIRDLSLAGLVFPFAQGTCDILSGDVAIFRDAGIFEPHIITHEFVHRKGYLKELHAQALAYLALRNSGHPLLVQSARAERLHRQLRVLAGEDGVAYDEELGRAGLREELRESFEALGPGSSLYQSVIGEGMKKLYDARMKLTGQNGLSDYDRGFTNFLHTFRFAEGARQPAAQAAV
ncbi:MAG TPA: DUF3810 family protein, partial [Longimicrobiales bacterium]|nr:DUF3810 family protein [Longimicrobiales bacterium]